MKNLLIAHLVGTYLVLSVLNLALVDTPLKAPLLAWMLMPLAYMISLPFVLPFAGLSLLVISLCNQQSIWAFTVAGAASGLSAIAFMGYAAPGLWNEGPYLLCTAATIGGAAGGYIFKLTTNSTSHATASS